MTIEEMSKTLRNCGSENTDCRFCVYKNHPVCHSQLAIDAADTLEGANKKIEELKQDNQMLKNTIDSDKGVLLDQIRHLEAQLSIKSDQKWLSVTYNKDSREIG